MSRRGTGLVVLVLAAVVTGTSRADAHVTVPSTFRDVVASADTIVRGQVTDVRTEVTADREVRSLLTIAVEALLKGDAGSFVTVVLPGGDLGRTRVVMVGAPRLRPLDRGVFFLTRASDGLYRPVGLSAGIYRLRAGPGAAAVVYPPPDAGSAATGPIVRGDPTRRPLGVAEFDALVRLLVRARAVPIVRRRP